MKAREIRRFDTDIEVCSYKPSRDIVTTIVKDEPKTIDKHVHDYFEDEGWFQKLVVNLSFFNDDGSHCGFLYLDGGFLISPPSEDDYFTEMLIMKDGSIIIEDLSLKEFNEKYREDCYCGAGLSYTLMKDDQKYITKTKTFEHYKNDEPRMFIGFNKYTKEIIVCTAKGRKNGNRGLTADEQYEVLKELGATEGINGDGGFSTALKVEDKILCDYGRPVPITLMVYSRHDIDVEWEGEDKKMKVCLDAGHGINTPGKRTPKFDDGTFIHEAEENYPVMFKVQEYLEFNGIEVVLTNPDINVDMSLEDRVKVANDNGANIFVSIHKNAFKGVWQTTAHGISTYIHMKGYNAEKLAKKLQDNLIKDTDMTNRGVKEWEGLYVTKYTNMPAALVELGFMDYLKEAKQMKDPLWHLRFATSITKGICEYFKIEAKFPVTHQDTELEKANLKIKELEEKVKDLTKDLFSKDMKIQELNNQLTNIKPLLAEIERMIN